MKSGRASFALFRYQILPIDRHFQGDLFDEMRSVDDLILHKNRFFAEALRNVEVLESGTTETTTKRLLATDDFFLYRVAANRSLHREKKDFTEEELDNWPSLLVAVWNDPERQLIAVQKRHAAFQKPETVARMILRSVEKVLTMRYLAAFFEPLFEKKVFWDIIENNEGKISSISFELITPNMANISGCLSEDLKQFAKATNSTKNQVTIEASRDSSLHIEPENEAVQGLVEYTSKGGGDIAIKISGMKRKMHTSRTVREIELDEVELNGTAEEVAALLKVILP